MNAALLQATVHDPVIQAGIPVWLYYPTCSPETPQPLGRYTIEAAIGGEPVSGFLRVAVISHGDGGSPHVYRTLARHLARRGFAVLCLEHHRNNRDDNSWRGAIANLAARPRHLSFALDWLFQESPLASQLTPHRAAVIGHSLGGYTALAAAGGRPTAFAHETPEGAACRVEVQIDQRLAALVLLAPAAAWFLEPGSLSAVRLPVLMLTAEHDAHTPPGHAEIVLRDLPAGSVDHRVIPGAGHFSFLSPFPPEMRLPGFLPAQDPPGFDRGAFQERLNETVAGFLDAHL